MNIGHAIERARALVAAHSEHNSKRRRIDACLRKCAVLSDVAIAALCQATDKTVAKYRRQLEATGEIEVVAIRYGLDGRKIDVSGLMGMRR